MQFFLALVMIYPQDPVPRRFYFQYPDFAGCSEARAIWTQPMQSGAPRVISAVCVNGTAPPPTAEQIKEDDEILRALREHFR